MWEKALLSSRARFTRPPHISLSSPAGTLVSVPWTVLRVAKSDKIKAAALDIVQQPRVFRNHISTKNQAKKQTCKKLCHHHLHCRRHIRQLLECLRLESAAQVPCHISIPPWLPSAPGLPANRSILSPRKTRSDQCSQMYVRQICSDNAI